MKLEGRLRISETEIKRMVIAEVQRRFGVELEIGAIWLGLTHAGATACEAIINMENHEMWSKEDRPR